VSSCFTVRKYPRIPKKMTPSVTPQVLELIRYLCRKTQTVPDCLSNRRWQQKHPKLFRDQTVLFLSVRVSWMNRFPPVLTSTKLRSRPGFLRKLLTTIKWWVPSDGDFLFVSRERYLRQTDLFLARLKRRVMCCLRKSVFSVFVCCVFQLTLGEEQCSENNSGTSSRGHFKWGAK